MSECLDLVVSSRLWEIQGEDGTANDALFVRGHHVRFQVSIVAVQSIRRSSSAGIDVGILRCKGILRRS